jgi:hypothetical protein
MSVKLSRLAAYLIALPSVLGYEGYVLFVQESGVAENIASSSDRHLTGEVAGDAALVQGLVPYTDGFDGIDVWAHATDGTPRGPVVFTITPQDGSAADSTVRVSYPAAAVVASPPPFHVTFPRIDTSAGRPYTVRIAAPQATPGQGLRFEASGPAYRGGAMTLGGREEWGDLQFRTTAERATIYRNLSHLRQSSPKIVRSDLFLGLMLLVFNGAIAVLLYDLAFARNGR